MGLWETVHAIYIGLFASGVLPLRPGEISLAHRGVLFLDELPEFARHSLESLRQPLEEGCIVVSRVRGSLRLPARFQLVAAMNPCPCGFGDGVAACRCTVAQARNYARRLSGPLLDRIDLHVEVPRLCYSELSGAAGEPSSGVLARVEAARARQSQRGLETRQVPNARLGGPELRRVAQPDSAGRALLARALDRWGLSARAHDRILRVSRTLADLEGAKQVEAHHVAEALQFRRCGADTGE
jgi:magnesium chelatase family protein